MQKKTNDIEQIVPSYTNVNCILCGNGDACEPVYERPSYLLQTTTHSLCFDINYQICRNCGLVFMNPQLSQRCWLIYLKNDSFSTMPTHVDVNRFEAHLPLIFRDFCRKKISQYTQILDIGCGDGHFLYYLKKTYNCVPFGIDLSERYCKYLKNILGVSAENISLEDFSPKKNLFDIIISRHVFEHLDNPISSLKKVYNLLADDGYFVFEVPSVHYPSFSFRDMFSAHSFLFSPITMRRAIMGSGFSIVSADEDNCLKYILQKTKAAQQLSYANDYQTVRKTLTSSLKKYEQTNINVKNKMLGYIQDWQTKNTPVAIWGAGEHTLSIFSKFDLSKCNIQFLIDSNSLLWGTKFNGYPVVSPNEIKNGTIDELLISSQPYELEIKNNARKINPAIKVCTLYSDT